MAFPAPLRLSRGLRSFLNLPLSCGLCIRCNGAQAQHLPHSTRHSSSALNASSLPSSAYVHLPFCRRRCHYCDFPIVAVGERTREAAAAEHVDSAMASYVDLVCKEISASASSSRLRTVFFGGGTPSLVPARLLGRIIECLEATHGISPGSEISMEMDPGTFDAAYLADVISSGVNRVSLGVQSFDDELLKLCGRAHGVKEAYEAIGLLKSSSGLSNWSLDLISSLPRQSLQQWQRSLSEAIAAEPAHVSVYDLQIEQGTKFGNLYKPGQSPLPSDDDSAEFYRTASRMLREAGYEHYEISNYAKKGFQCSHNLVYWGNQPYYAYGLGSTSYVGGRRLSRSRKMKEYAEFVEKLQPVDEEVPQESVEERMLDTVMLALRLADGIDLQQFGSEFGHLAKAALCEGLQEFADSGHVLPVDALRKPLREQDLAAAAHVRLADPEGFLLSSEIIARLFCVLTSKKNEAQRMPS